MKRFNTASVPILAALLLACLGAVYMTRDSGAPISTAQKTAPTQSPVVDIPMLETAHRVAAFAETAVEQDQAREALRLADRELDEAFSTASREAAAFRVPSTGPLHELSVRLNQVRDQLAADRERVAQLTKQTASTAAADQLEIAKAQLALDQDELEDAHQDLDRQGGDPHAALQRAVQAHEAAQHNASQTLGTSAGSQQQH